MGAPTIDLRIESSQGTTFDGCRVLRLSASERASSVYRVEVDVVCPDDQPLELDDAAGASVSVVIARGDEAPRRFGGVVTHVSELPQLQEGWHAYRLIVHPRMWLGSLVTNYDVHLDVTVPAIVAEKLDSIGAPHVLALGTYPARELVTQYGETDLAFISRLCEHLGIHFFFDQGEDGERVVFGDDVSAYRPVGDEEKVLFGGRGDHVGVYEIAETRTLIPAFYVSRDYNHLTPLLDLEVQHELAEGAGGGFVEYGGHIRTEEEGKHLARVRAEEHLGARSRFTGKSSDLRFAPGHTFALEGHPRHSRRFVLIEVEHEAHQSLFAEQASHPVTYENRFVAIPAELTHRPPRITPIPKAYGLVTGVVEKATTGVESYAKVDDQGRYVVCFLFDSAGPDRVRASAPLRMVQASAGPGYGMHFPLKPGVEVVLGFVDGNVDRPIIVGAVPNPITPTPVALDASTKSRILTRSGILIEFDDANRRT